MPISPDMVSGFDAVIHLAGESIVGRWTKTKKIKIRGSRVAGTTTLAEALAGAQAQAAGLRLQFGDWLLRRPRQRSAERGK